MHRPFFLRYEPLTGAIINGVNANPTLGYIAPTGHP